MSGKRKWITMGILSAVVASLVLAGCSPSGNPGDSSAASGQTAMQTGDKELTIAIYRDGEMDMLDAATYKGPHVMYKMLYEGLVEDGGKNGIQPQLATSWNISEDGKTYTFHLREGVKFSDGTDFNADAVCFNLARWVNNDRHASLTSYAVESYRAVDEHTVEIVFKEGSYPILTELTYPRPVRFLSPSSIEKVEGDVMGKFTKPVGTGQWMLESYTPEQEFVLVPNPYYWGEKPALNKITFKVIPDGQARIMALQSGEVDIIGGDLLGKISLEGVQELQNSGQWNIQQNTTMNAYYMGFSQGNPVLQDVKVRQAINYAIDKESMVSNMFYGIGSPAKGMYDTSVPYVTEENSPGYAYDLEKAKSLMSEAGYTDSNGDGFAEDKNGENITLKLVLTTEENPEWKPMAEYVQSELAKIGLKIDLETLDTNAYNEVSMTTLDYDLIFQRTSSDSWLPHGDMKILFTPLSVAQNRARVWYDEDLIQTIQSTMNQQDETKRQEGYDKIFRKINDEALVVPLYYPMTTFAMNDKVANFEFGVNSYDAINWTKLSTK